MVCCTLDTIKSKTKIQVVTFILFSSADFLCLGYEIYLHDNCEVNYITCAIYALTGCVTDRNQSLSIITDHYSAHDNKNEGGMCGGGIC